LITEKSEVKQEKEDQSAIRSSQAGTNSFLGIEAQGSSCLYGNPNHT
jgi:hypothetical protein